MTDLNNNRKKYKQEFNDDRIHRNVNRCKKFGFVIILLNLLLITIDLIIYKPDTSILTTYFYLYYSHVLVFIFTLFWVIYFKLHKTYGNITSIRFLSYVFIFINLCWNIFMGLNNLYLSGQICSYIICILSISVSLYLTPLEAIFTFLFPHIFYILGLVHIVRGDTKLLCCHIINSSVAVLTAIVVSRINYAYFSKDFMQRKELEISNQKLKEYEKLRTDFFANISHELKTPINVISCAQQMIETLLKQDECKDLNLNKYLKMIKQNSYRLIKLVCNLIDITKIDSFNFDVKLINIDIIKVIEDITMSVAPYIESKELSITFDTSVEEKIISCDPQQIERILLNLLSNSIKFTDKGGSILVNIYLKDDNVCIAVKDTGIGIPDEMKELIFDRFIQVDKSISKNSEGCGIGLSLVKSIIEMHGGSIYVNSILNEGSEFIITLPNHALDESGNIEDLSIIENEVCIKKMNIEFSDIYDY